MLYEIRKTVGYRPLQVSILVLLILNLILTVLFIQSLGTAELPAVHTEHYVERVNLIIEEAKDNLNSYDKKGINPDSFIYKYQIFARETYLNLLPKVAFNDTADSVIGWNTYFSYPGLNIFILIAVIVVSISALTVESNGGILLILRSTKNGRTRTGISKICSVFALSIGTAIIMCLETWLVVFLTSGFSDPSHPIQSLEVFILCPFDLKIGEYFILSIFMKCIAGVLCSAVALLIGVLLRDTVLAYIASIGYLGIQIVLNSLRYLNDNSILKNLNLISLADANGIFSRFRCVEFFNQTNNLFVFAELLIPFCFLSCSVLTVWRYSVSFQMKSSAAKSLFLKIKSILISATQKKLKNTCRPQYCVRSILITEMYKSVISVWSILGLIVLLVLKFFLDAVWYTSPGSYEDKVYHDYIREVAGEINDQKELWLKQEYNKIHGCIDSYSEKRIQYEKKDLSYEEYKEYLELYDYSYNRVGAIDKAIAQLTYIQNQKSNGRDAWFVYDTGWNVFFSRPFDWTLFSILIILLSKSFTIEFLSTNSASGFIQILSVTKHGRRKTFWYKILSGLLISTIIFFVCNFIDFLYINHNYALPISNAPVQSLEIFQTIPFKLSIRQFSCIYYEILYLSVIILACLTLALSSLLKKDLSVVAYVCVVTLLPMFLAKNGIEWLDYLSFTSIMTCSVIIQQKPLVILFWLSTSICLLFNAQKKWVYNANK